MWSKRIGFVGLGIRLYRSRHKRLDVEVYKGEAEDGDQSQYSSGGPLRYDPKNLGQVDKTN